METYWLNTAGSGYKAIIHRASCGSCNNGKGVAEIRPDHIAEYWYGAYPTRGAAIDAALALTDLPVAEDGCISDRRINP